MSKRYEEPADVEAPDGRIAAFWWRGRRYRVDAVLGRWREAGGWWEAPADTAQPWARGESREIWRVDAAPDAGDAVDASPETPDAPAARTAGPRRPARSAEAPRAVRHANARARHPAGRKRRIPSGTYELCRDLRKGTWILSRVLD